MIHGSPTPKASEASRSATTSAAALRRRWVAGARGVFIVVSPVFRSVGAPGFRVVGLGSMARIVRYSL